MSSPASGWAPGARGCPTPPLPGTWKPPGPKAESVNGVRSVPTALLNPGIRSITVHMHPTAHAVCSGILLRASMMLPPKWRGEGRRRLVLPLPCYCRGSSLGLGTLQHIAQIRSPGPCWLGAGRPLQDFQKWLFICRGGSHPHCSVSRSISRVAQGHSPSWLP